MRPRESFVGQPVRSLQTMLRVIAEDDPSYPTLVPDGIYGQETITAVSTFQRKNALPITGITDQQTWEAIVEEYESAFTRIHKAQPIEIIMNPGMVYKRGDSSPYLLLLQSMLLYLSKYHKDISPPPHNGILDDATADSLSMFQTISGMTPTGELDKITWKYLVNFFTLTANIHAGKNF